VQFLYRTAVSGRVAVHTSERRVERSVGRLPRARPVGGAGRVLNADSAAGPGFQKNLSIGYEPRLI
jgi:hypothetical protein